MNAGYMRRAVVNTAICFLVFIANAAGGGDLYISWSDSEYVEVLTVSGDTTATCYVLVQDDGAEFVGYEFWMILSDEVEVIAHQPALFHAVDELTTPDELHSGPNYVFLIYLDCESLTGLTCVASFDVAINATAVQDNPGTSGLFPFESTSPPYILLSLIPDNCLELAGEVPFDTWSPAIVVADEVPVDASTWSSIKALFSTVE